MNAATLYLVAAPLDFGCDASALGDIRDTLPQGTMVQAAALRHWIAENAKSARALLARIHAVQALAVPIQQMHIAEMPRALHKLGDHTPLADAQLQAAVERLLDPLRAGCDMGLCSEAGMPAVADPGASIVRAAHAMHCRVVALPGPSAVLLALAASGLNGQRFAFVGYLPQNRAQRTQTLLALQAASERQQQSQWWIETPYRNAGLLAHALEVLHPDTLLSLSLGLSLPQAHTRSASVAQWRAQPVTLPLHLPAVYGLMA